jgi:putative Holliday junction resolvase
MDGTAGPAAEIAHAFAGALRAEGIDVVLWDERLTTVEAERSLAAAGTRGRARRAVVDTVAASVILQSYLDAAR